MTPLAPTPTITVNVDATNPGQFFACCALLELADRRWSGAEGWFSRGDGTFLIAARGSLEELVEKVATAELTAVRPSDIYSSPLIIGEPFHLVIDWWESDSTGAKDLKVWAGSMESVGIARAMQGAMREDPRFRGSDLFNVGMVAMTADDPPKPKVPYHFDARRSTNAHTRDVGFATDTVKLESVGHPAVEFLCLVGLQVSRPAPTNTLRVYDYFTWHVPLLPSLLLAATTGSLGLADARGYRFQNWFRTGQKKHKAFRPAVPLS